MSDKYCMNSPTLVQLYMLQSSQTKQRIKMRYCSVHWCQNTSLHLKMPSFPHKGNEPARHQIWCDFAQPKSLQDRIKKNSVICADHFPKHYHRTLPKDAVPSSNFAAMDKIDLPPWNVPSGLPKLGKIDDLFLIFF